jgi:hypothetical protein
MAELGRAGGLPAGRDRNVGDRHAAAGVPPVKGYVMGLRHHGLDGPTFQMREKIFAIGDDFLIEDANGNRVYKVDGKAVRLRDTFILEDAQGNELRTPRQGDRSLGPRDCAWVSTSSFAVETNHCAGTARRASQLVGPGTHCSSRPALSVSVRGVSRLQPTRFLSSIAYQETTMTDQPQRPAGWYPTPDGRQRFWDGAQWTPDVVAAGPATRAQDVGPGRGQHEVVRSTRTALGGVLLVVEVVVAVLGVLIAYVFTAEYGDITASTLDAMTSGFVWLPLVLIGAAAVGAVLTSKRPWVRVTAVAIPVLMVVGMLVAFPAALASKREVQYDADGPQCGASERMGPAAEDVAQAQRAFDSIVHVGFFGGGGGEGEGGCFRTFIPEEKVDVLQHYGGALPAAGWTVVESEGQRLRAEREGMAFEVAVCDVDGTGGAVGVVWAGKVTAQSEARCDRI